MTLRPLAKNKITVVTPTIPPRGVMLGRASASVQAQKRPADGHVVAMDWTGAGPGATRNQALNRVTTEWVAFLDDDDEFLPHHLRACEKMAFLTGADVIYPIGRYSWSRDPLRQAGQPFDATRLRLGNFIPVTVLARTALILDVGGFPIGDKAPLHGGWQRCEDWGLWLAMLSAGATFAPLHQETWVCHSHAGPYGNFSGRSWTPTGAQR